LSPGTGNWRRWTRNYVHRSPQVPIRSLHWVGRRGRSVGCSRRLQRRFDEADASWLRCMAYWHG
jgi:hypothetical protein